MAYRRYSRSYRYRRPYRRYTRKPVSRYSVYSSAGKQLYKDVMYLKSLLNVEYKVIDTAISVSPSSSAGTAVHLNAIGQGDDKSQRSGRQVKMNYINCNFSVKKNSGAGDTIVRYWLLIDKEGGTGFTWTDFQTSVDVNSLNNTDGTYRFKTLATGRVSLNANYPEKNIKINRKIGTRVKFNGTGSTNIESNTLLLAFCSDEATNVPTVTGLGRVRFIDN